MGFSSTPENQIQPGIEKLARLVSRFNPRFRRELAILVCLGALIFLFFLTNFFYSKIISCE